MGDTNVNGANEAPSTDQPPPGEGNTPDTTASATKLRRQSATCPSQLAEEDPSVALLNQGPRRHSSVEGEGKTQVKKRPEDFLFGKVLGEGSYSTVFLAKEVHTNIEYAIKVVEKRHIIKEKKVEAVTRERDVMSRLNHPFFVSLYFTFQDIDRLYFAMNYARRGELLEYINKLECFDEMCTRFYTAEIVSALEYLHGRGIIHRDLKPENILLNDDMHIQITDFGSAKILANEKVLADVAETTVNPDKETRPRSRKNSFVGTAQYVSPEVLNGVAPTTSTDLWALGCILYQLSSGQLPFWGGHEYQIFQKILKLEYVFPSGFHTNAKDLVQNLLVLEPGGRLGCKERGGYEPLKSHQFFTGVEWDSLSEQTPPTLQPYLPAIDEQSTDFYSNLKPGFDPKQIGQLVIDPLLKSESAEEAPPKPQQQQPKKETWFTKTMPKSEEERKQRLRDQAQKNEYHKYVDNNLILHQGFLDKRKGLFARKRMFLLTEGPHLYYVDTGHSVLKGQLPWSKHLRPECKDFKIFFVHTPNRIYYLEDRYERNSLDWCQKILQVWQHYYEPEKAS